MEKDSKPVLSIIMPAYQAAQTLEWSVQSVMQQSYTDWELLLLVDAASDSTEEIALSLASRDKRIRLFVSKRNRGVVRTRNIALRLARGKYVAFLDADDYWVPEKLSRQLSLLQKHNANFCYTSARYVRHDLNWKSAPARMPAQLNLRRLLMGNPIGMSTVLMDVESIGKFYFETLPAPYVHEDYAYWVRLFAARKIKTVFLNEPATEVTIHHQTRSGNKLLALKSQYFILRTIAGAGSLKASFYILSYVLLALHKRGIRSWLRQLFK
jgi:teichuronic acid biosynthesis glycosyltransferase TuaG